MVRPVPTARAPSGAEGAGPIAGGGLVTAKADEYLVEWSRLPRSDKVFLLDRPRPVFFFEKENGGRSAPEGGHPRRHKLRIRRSAASGRVPSLRCASSPHRTRCAGLRRGPSLSPWLAIKRKLPRPAGQGSPFPILILSGCLCGQPDSPGTHGRGRRSG